MNINVINFYVSVRPRIGTDNYGTDIEQYITLVDVLAFSSVARSILVILGLQVLQHIDSVESSYLLYHSIIS